MSEPHIIQIVCGTCGWQTSACTKVAFEWHRAVISSPAWCPLHLMTTERAEPNPPQTRTTKAPEK